MGYIAHNAIVVTCWSDETIEAAADYARGLGFEVAGPTADKCNGYRSILLAPDGSKEGWQTSEYGDKRRDAFVAWMKQQTDHYFEWVEVRYGNDDETATLVRHEWSALKEAGRE